MDLNTAPQNPNDDAPPGFLPVASPAPSAVPPAPEGPAQDDAPPGFTTVVREGSSQPPAWVPPPLPLPDADPAQAQTDIEHRNAVNSFWDKTMAGRVVKAFGIGFDEGSGGSEPLGITDPAFVKTMQDVGLFRNPKSPMVSRWIQGFDESVIRGTAWMLEGSMRTLGGLTRGAERAEGKYLTEIFGGNDRESIDIADEIDSWVVAAQVVTGTSEFGIHTALSELPPVQRPTMIAPYAGALPKAAEAAREVSKFAAGEVPLGASKTVTGDSTVLTEMTSLQVELASSTEAIAAPVTEAAAPSVAPAFNASAHILPQELSKATPRFKTSEISFGNDIDRALYIVRAESKKKSARHDDYMDFLRKAGLSDAEIVTGSQEVAAAVKAGATEPGTKIELGAVFKRQTEAAPAPEPMRLPPAGSTNLPPERAVAMENPSAGAVLRGEPRYVDKAGNLNLNYIDTEEDIKQSLRELAEKNGDHMEARGAPVSWEETIKTANAMGVSPEWLARRPYEPGELAAASYSGRSMLVQAAADVKRLAKAAESGKAADILAYAQAENRQLMIATRLSNLSAELGRALNAHKILVGEVNDAQRVVKTVEGVKVKPRVTPPEDGALAPAREPAPDELALAPKPGEPAKKPLPKTEADLIREATGEEIEAIQKRIQAVNGMETPEQIAKFLNEARKPSRADMFYETWVNGLISGLVTHAQYAKSALLFTLWKPLVETPIAAAVGATREALGLAAVDGGRVYLGETGAQLYGMVSAIPDAFRAGAAALKTGDMQKLPGQGVLETTNPFLHRPAVPGKLGVAVRTPSRLVMSIDSFFRIAAYRQTIGRLAYRQAMQEGLEGEAFASRVSYLRSDPTAKMIEQYKDAIARQKVGLEATPAEADVIRKFDMMSLSRDEAARQLFMAPLGEFGQKVEKVMRHNLATKMISPFIRVGGNITREGAIERTPFGLLSETVRGRLKGLEGGAALDEQVAKLAAGAALGAWVMTLRAQDKLTGGGPSDHDERDAWINAGHQPYSIRIGDMWYPYRYYAPFAQPIGIAADMYELGDTLEEGHADHIAAKVAASFAHNITDETWMRGPSEMMQAIEDPDRYGDKYVRSQVSTLLPFSSMLSQTARSMDPDGRQANTIIEAFKAKIPVLRETLLPDVDVWGRQKQGREVTGPLVSYGVPVANDPVANAVLDIGIYPAAPDKKIQGVALTPEQYLDYKTQAGTIAYQTLSGIVNSPDWKANNNLYAKRKLVSSIIEASRDSARKNIIMKYKIMNKIMENRKAMVEGKPTPN